MNARVVWAIAQKDIAATFGTRAVLAPALYVPLMQVLGITLYVALLGRDRDAKALGDLPSVLVGQWLAQLPPALAHSLHGLPPGPTLAVIIAGQLVAPTFLLSPISITMLVGAAAFVGEKERRTLEALLYTPASDGELLLGKALAAVLPALAIAWASFALYAVLLTFSTWSFMHRVWFPTAVWWPWMLWVLPATLMLAAGATVMISARSQTQLGASQLGSLFAGMLTLTVMGEVTGHVNSSSAFIWLAGGVLWALNLAIWLWAVRDFSRARLIQRL